MACSLLCSALQEAVTHGLFPSLQCITRSSHAWLVPFFAVHYKKQSHMACSLLCSALQEAVTHGLFPSLQCITRSSHAWIVPFFAVHYRKQSRMACDLRYMRGDYFKDVMKYCNSPSLPVVGAEGLYASIQLSHTSIQKVKVM